MHNARAIAFPTVPIGFWEHTRAWAIVVYARPWRVKLQITHYGSLEPDAIVEYEGEYLCEGDSYYVDWWPLQGKVANLELDDEPSSPHSDRRPDQCGTGDGIGDPGELTY